MTIRELTEEDFKRAVQNPFFEKLNKKVEIFVRNDDYELFSSLGKPYDETPEDVIRRMLIHSASSVRESGDE